MSTRMFPSLFDRLLASFTAGMTWKRALLAVALGTTLGASVAKWDTSRKQAWNELARPIDPVRFIAADSRSDFFKPAALGESPPAPAEAPAPGLAVPAAVAAMKDEGAATPERTAREARLLADLARARLQPPAEIEQLFDLSRRGKRASELRGFVRTRFPRNTRLRALTFRYIKAVDSRRLAVRARAR